mgnify:CR=1 FL=1
MCCADYTDGDVVDTSLHSHAYCAGYLTGSVVSEDGKDCVCPDGKIEEAGECVDAPQITLDNPFESKYSNIRLHTKGWW